MKENLDTRNDDVELEEYLELSSVHQKSQIVLDDKRIAKKRET